mmetsp:Transcript_1997/g.3483  ORF Transcript_1997/g.3483 Transcript_1997/m.3483 type:complete len:388 (-) Transcript_1997:190-1353(-)
MPALNRTSGVRCLLRSIHATPKEEHQRKKSSKHLAKPALRGMEDMTSVRRRGTTGARVGSLATFWFCLQLVQLLGLSGAVIDLRVAVCVVGQVARTELKSKVDNLIVPNLGTVDIDVFLILQPGKARFTNLAHPECNVAPTSLHEAETLFSEHARTFVFENAFVDLDVPAAKWLHFPERRERRVRRLTNHINQYLSWKRCANMVSKQELADGGNKARYDAVLRLRDNALVLSPFPLRDRLTALVHDSYRKLGKEPPNPITNQHVRGLPVIVKACSSWGGYSDKTLLAPRKYMDDALSGPAELFYLMRKGHNRTDVGEGKVSNPETYLKRVFQKLHVPVAKEWKPELFPITDGRCEDGESFCVVIGKKDCRPANVSVTECTDRYINRG